MIFLHSCIVGSRRMLYSNKDVFGNKPACFYRVKRTFIIYMCVYESFIECHLSIIFFILIYMCVYMYIHIHTLVFFMKTYMIQ